MPTDAMLDLYLGQDWKYPSPDNPYFATNWSNITPQGTDASGRPLYRFEGSKVPVPKANVPGASYTPSSTYRKQANQVQAITDLLPYLQSAIAGQAIPTAQAQLAAQKSVAPGMNQLMLDLYKQYGPQLAEIGNQVAKQNALAQVDTDAAALTKAQESLIPEALDAAKMYDPEYFATREKSAARLAELLGNIDLTSGLSDVERREIEQSQAREGTRRGNYNAPSNLAAIENAMQYGDKGFQRLQTNRSALSTAINAATQALPSFKSGVDVFQVATGKSSVPNAGESKFTGIPGMDNIMNTSANLAGNMNSNMTSMVNTQEQVNAQKKDWADYLNQVTSSIGNIVGMGKGLGI